MEDEKQLSDVKMQLEAAGLHKIVTLPVLDKLPKQIAQEIEHFRQNYGTLDMGKAKFYTYDLYDMVIGMLALKTIKEKWERYNTVLTGTHEVTLSVYPAMDLTTNKFNFYFIPTWVKKGVVMSGQPINGAVIDFADSINMDPHTPYPDTVGYIYDLGSSCP